MLPVIGLMLPSARLKRHIRTRTDTIFKDLPDIIDMLAIAVEAGCGFDAALSIVCQHFDSPMADELRLALQGMELGMPRREVLQELKRRTDLDVVRTFVLALIQADALGIPDRSGAHLPGHRGPVPAAGLGPGEGGQAAGEDHVPAGPVHLPADHGHRHRPRHRLLRGL